MSGRPKLRRIAVAALAAAFTTALLSPPASAQETPPPQEDAFYLPPKGLKGKQPGTVLRSRPVDVSGNGYGLGTPVDAWQVLYRSTTVAGKPNAVSGTVLVPRQEWTDGPRPLVSYSVGTHGLGPECAPSYKLATGTEREFSLFNQALRRGWAVVVTDYEGLGTPGPHTYVAGRSLGHAVLDAARAAQALPQVQLSADAPVGLWGYSEGGFAAGWASELAAGYAPELDVVGSAVGAAPADVAAMARVHDGGPASGLVIAGAVGLAKAYPGAPFAEILNGAGRRMAEDIATMCTEEMSARYAFRTVEDYTTVDDPMSLPRWQKVLSDIELGNGAPQAPVMIYQSVADELVLFDQAVRLYRNWCDAGSDVLFNPLALGEHVTGAITGSPMAVEYLGARFAGRELPNACAARP